MFYLTLLHAQVKSFKIAAIFIVGRDSNGWIAPNPQRRTGYRPRSGRSRNPHSRPDNRKIYLSAQQTLDESSFIQIDWRNSSVS